VIRRLLVLAGPLLLAATYVIGRSVSALWATRRRWAGCEYWRLAVKESIPELNWPPRFAELHNLAESTFHLRKTIKAEAARASVP